jgi:hypothetical protein
MGCMKIQLLSDLHLEWMPDWVPPRLPQADVLVLAGDVGSYQPRSRLPVGDGSHPRDWALSRFSPKLGWPTPVLYVPGNHEYDGLDFDQTHEQLRERCEALGITWLHHETVVLDGVRFVGSTLWSDFDALAVSHERSGKAVTPTQALQWREKAYRAANFYLEKTQTTYRGEPMLAAQVREQALLCQQWLGAALATPFAGRTVAVTHFAPSLRSADPRYGNAKHPGQPTAGTAGFCNVLDDWFDQADLWLHGHLHCPHDYRAGSAQNCRVVCNPLGYAQKGEQEGFQPGLLIELA